ncbi:fasciclin domain-containing protein [Niabella insulamsoli]|uniref:fasciclin domain-containing protein n=1 Tax=Niabella insulamsoli TaxID=3144874 RepID=UPI0031FDB05D
MGIFKMRWSVIFSILLLVTTACRKEITQYYHPQNALDKNIVEVLEQDSRFSAFVGLIDKVQLRKTLGDNAIYTCLAPTNEHVQQYFASAGYSSPGDAPAHVIRQYINYHFINGMYYEYDINKIYNQASSLIAKTRAANFTTRAEGKTPGKRIRLYSTAFLQNQPEDFESLYGPADNSERFMVEGIQIEEADIDASNGVIHILAAPLGVTLRTDEALAADPQTTIFSSWLEKHVQYELGEKDEFGWVDTTLYKSYSVGRNLASESVITTLLVPTNAAIQAYFEPYLPYIDNTLDSIPKRVMYSLIRAGIVDNIWLKGDLKRADPNWRSLGGFINMIMDVPAAIVGSVKASNSIIYKVDKVIESPEMNSVAGGILMRYKKYGQWYWMLLNAGLAEGLYDILYYQHAPKTLLVQSDISWGFPLAEDLNPTDRELKKQQLQAGILNIDVREDGGFRKRFYATSYGYIYYENEKFYDYTGHSVNLVSSTPEWNASNGAIYEIDGFLNPLDRLNDTLTLYDVLKKHPNLSLFVQALDKSGIASQLELTGFFTYTVLAPTNNAITGGGINVATMNAATARTFVQKYIIPNRAVFTDGVFTGQIPNKNNELLTINGAWENFEVTDPGGKKTEVETANLQGSNGVIHKIKNVF